MNQGKFTPFLQTCTEKAQNKILPEATKGSLHLRKDGNLPPFARTPPPPPKMEIKLIQKINLRKDGNRHLGPSPSGVEVIEEVVVVEWMEGVE